MDHLRRIMLNQLRARNSSEMLNGRQNFPIEIPLTVTPEIHGKFKNTKKGESHFTNIEKFKRKIRRIWQSTINTRHVE